jgi:dihydropteroate synthase
MGTLALVICMVHSVYAASMLLKWRSKTVSLMPGALMGVLNVTPDSFSDGGQYSSLELAFSQARKMIRDGAAILDIGGESSRPGAPRVSLETELERVIPLIESIKKAADLEVLISIDTRKSEVARAALQAGADLVNDVTTLRDPAMRAVCAEAGVPAIIMHMRGDPETMRYSSETHPFSNVVQEVRDELEAAANLALRDGVPSVVLDPGFGFGKSIEQNLELIRGLPDLKSLGHPLLLGASRKSTLGRITGVEHARDRDPGSIAAHLFGLSRGADLLRVHDVAGHAQAIQVWQALTGVSGG